MHLTSALTALLAITANAFAQPIEERDTTDMMATAASWTVQNFKRVCTPTDPPGTATPIDTSCAFTYSINKNDSTKPTACKYTVTGNPASRATYQNQKCGAFVIGSVWNSQGFTVLSMITNNQIIYPGTKSIGKRVI